MDTTDRYIEFDENGVCNHCKNFDEKVKLKILTKEEKQIKLREQIELIKSAGQGRKYDCIIGVSGGMDSSYVVYLAKEHGLRTLVVHFDNGWDAELAIKNIENMIKKTGFDYYNYIVDWDEFRDLQMSYFKASVVNIEVPTDMGISSLLPPIANKFNVPYILTGGNIETESIMGTGWNFPRKDYSNLLDIHKKYGTKRLKTFPLIRCYQTYYYNTVKNIKSIRLLRYSDCNYEKIKHILKKEFGWRDYGVKHGESTFTKFYQSYILPKKFDFDKRRAHLSTQINAGHITRNEALQIIRTSVYSDIEQKEDYNYVVKKWQLTEDEFEEIMNKPIVPHENFKVEQLPLIDKLLLKALQMFVKIRTCVHSTPKDSIV